MKKYSLWDDRDEVIFSCNDSIIFSATIQVNYPLGNFVHIYDLPEWVTIVFQFYKIVIVK